MPEKVKTSDTDTQLLKLGENKDVVSLRKCRLLVMQGEDKGKKFDLTQKPVRIGKKEGNDLTLSDKTVSRNHVEISFDRDSYLLKDLDSTNGTFINDMKVKEAYLAPGDVIKIGNTRIEFSFFDEKVQIEPSVKEIFGEVVGKSKKMRQIFSVLEKISPSDSTVIIEGETGTGKEMVARAIHSNSQRKDKPFVVFDCGSVAENLVESELFGHEKGAFTGAIKTRKGAFEDANGGTIFIDEIGELSSELQPKLLRALEQREVKKVGGNMVLPIDVRVVCATNRTLKKEVSEGRFREDLYYRLSVVRINIPPLRERPEDIPAFIELFLQRGRFNKKPDGGLKVIKVDDDALKMLSRYQWPGNVRELLNVLERVVPMVEGESIKGDNVSYILQELEKEDEMTERVATPNLNVPFKEAKQMIVEHFEKDYLASLLRKNNYNISKTAREAGIDRKHIRNLLKKYGIIEE